MLSSENLVKVILDFIAGFIAVALLAFPREYLKSYLALLLGDDTPKKAGRLSLNPFVHLDPVGTIAFILYGFGWTRPVPVRPWRMKIRKWGLLLVSAVGPILNFFEAYIFSSIAKNLQPDTFVYTVFYKSVKFSLVYSIFSLFPIPPLDGSRILGALLPDEYTEWYMKYEIYGVFFMLALLLLWILPLMMNPLVEFTNGIVSYLMNL